MQQSQCFQYFNIGSQNFVPHQNAYNGRRQLKKKATQSHQDCLVVYSNDEQPINLSPLRVIPTQKNNDNEIPFKLLESNERRNKNIEEPIKSNKRIKRTSSKSKGRPKGRCKNSKVIIKRTENQLNRIHEEQCSIEEEEDEEEEKKQYSRFQVPKKEIKYPTTKFIVFKQKANLLHYANK